MLPHLPYTAYLRVYQPISAYPSRARAAWSAYVESPHRPRRIASVWAEHEESLRRLVASPARIAPEQESEHAYVRRSGSEIFISPWQTRLRSWLAFQEFQRATPARLANAYVPWAVAEETRADFERWRARGEPVRPQILTSTWTVPLSWFVPFESGERCLVLGQGPGAAAAGGSVEDWSAPGWPDALARGEPVLAPTRALLYVTDMARARKRTTDAVDVLRRAVGDSALLTATEQVQEWLHDWHPRSLIELDYGGLVRLLGDEDLLQDHSVAEVAAAIAGLETSERELALAMYQRVTRRWRAVEALRHAN